MKFIYPAVFRKNEEGRYKAFFPDLACCEAEGDTLDDAIDNEFFRFFAVCYVDG